MPVMIKAYEIQLQLNKDLFECLTFCENKILKLYFIYNIKVTM